MTNADLSRANLKGVKFNNSLLIGSNLSQADLSFCDLSDANMSNANISGTNLQGAKMFDTVLNGVDLTKALTIEQARLCVDLHDHDFRGLKDRSFDIGFYGGQLIKANFEGTRLNAPTFEGTNLEYANFQNADLTGFTKRPSFVSANLSGANFKKALLTNATFELANLSNTNFEGADLRGANFSRANIKGAKFKNANLDGAQGKGCYLTTVCVDAMNLPDDCHELETLRKFRDGFVSKTQKGKDLIKEYYDIAPKIIDAIKMTVNEESIFKDLYKSINEIVLLIDVMEYEKAFEAYCKLTLNLKYQYLK